LTDKIMRLLLKKVNILMNMIMVSSNYSCQIERRHLHLRMTVKSFTMKTRLK